MKYKQFLTFYKDKFNTKRGISVRLPVKPIKLFFYFIFLLYVAFAFNSLINIS